MDILGIDFTSSPSRRKPITCLRARLEHAKLSVEYLQEWSDFGAFEDALRRPGPWIAGIDFPFGQSRRFIETIGWPQTWAGYVGHAAGMSKAGFEDALTRYRQPRAPGDKEHRRATDIAAGSISPQKLYGVPVGRMFFEGAPRLLRIGVTIPHIQKGDPDRIAVEAYPGILARNLVGRRSYKNDTRKKQTPEQHDARREILTRLTHEAVDRFGFTIDAPLSLCDDPGADHLDALLCAVQAAWSWTERANGYGAPSGADPLEGWIADPTLRDPVARESAAA